MQQKHWNWVPTQIWATPHLTPHLRPLCSTKHDIICEISNLQNIVPGCLTHPWNRAGADRGPEHFISAAVRRIAKYQVDWCKKIVWTLRGVCVFVEGANLCSIRNIEEHWIFEIFATIRTIMGHIRHRIHLSWNIWQTTSVYPEKQSANSMALSVEEKVKQLKKWKFHRKDESFTEKINVSGKIKCSLKRSKLLRNAKKKTWQ